MDSLDRVHHVLIIEDPSFQREFNLEAATYSLGRHSSNDIVLSCQKTSRNHATLLRRTDVKTNKYAYWILDGDLQGNRSRNGIYVNGKKTLVHELKDGDVIQFSGDASARYKITTEKPEQSSSINYSNNSNVSTPQKTVLNKETIAVASLKPIGNSKSSTSDNSSQISLTELSPQPIIETDLYGNIIYINSAGIINFKDIHHQKLNHPLLKDLISIYQQGEDNIINREVTVKDKTFLQTAHYLPDNQAIRNYIVDISQQKALELKLQYKANLYDRVSQNITEAIVIIESATKQIVDVNPACSQLLGYSQAQMLQMNIYELCEASEKFSVVLQKTIANKNNFSGECLLRHQDGHIINTLIKISLIDSGLNQKLCLIIDTSSQSTNLLQESQIISKPPLSEKDIFKQQINTAIANTQRSKKLLAVMFCKLYFLPDITANIGIEKSQELISNLGKRLSSSLRSGDTVVHWQEDKFALLMPHINNIEEIAKINQRIRESLEQSFKLGGINVTLNSSFGIAIYPQDGVETDVLLANANIALERAYKNKNSYQFFNQAMNSQALVALELESLLKKALEQEEFQLHYQPQIDINTGKTKAIEALLRWQHPELGLVSPSNFIKSAEVNSLIVPIGEWTIYKACLQNKTWQSQGLPLSKIIVSLSSVQFKQSNLVQKIAEILAETNLEPQLLELEISAVSLLENIDYSKKTLNRLKELGVHIAVDNFIAGFSNLEYLKYLPLDTLKIDRSLVQQLTDNLQSKAIATALIEIGKGFGLHIVAEGVETQEQVDLLQSLNCQYMQGYWFGRPLAADEATKLLPFDYPEAKTELVEMEREVEHLPSVESESGKTLSEAVESLKSESAKTE